MPVEAFLSAEGASVCDGGIAGADFAIEADRGTSGRVVEVGVELVECSSTSVDSAVETSRLRAML